MLQHCIKSITMHPNNGINDRINSGIFKDSSEEY